MTRQMTGYYGSKLATLRDIFGAKDVSLSEYEIAIDGKIYPIIDDVIVLLDPSQYTDKVREILQNRRAAAGAQAGIQGAFSESIQFNYGREWERFNEVSPEYNRVFNEYFDIVDLKQLEGKRVADIGCGTGRWSKLLSERVKLGEIVCLDFSDAIFVARKNLRGAENALFFMGDLQRLAFREDAFDFLYSLGVLLTLPTDQLQEVRRLKRYAPRLLFYVYYALDNRPWTWRAAFIVVDKVRRAVCEIRSKAFREAFTWFIAAFVYVPLIGLGHLLKPLGLNDYVPLYNEHHYMNFRWWRLLAYDRFFTSIEQRVTRKEILTLKDSFSEVIVSPNSGFWHFLCVR